MNAQYLVAAPRSPHLECLLTMGRNQECAHMPRYSSGQRGRAVNPLAMTFRRFESFSRHGAEFYGVAHCWAPFAKGR